MKSPPRPYLWMLLGSLSFAIMGTLTRQLADCYDWHAVAFTRSLVPFVSLSIVCVLFRVKLVFIRPPVLWLRSIAGSLSIMGTFYALSYGETSHRLPVPVVLTLTNLFPVWVALLSWPLLGEAPSPSILLSIGCGLIGVIFIQQPHVDHGNRALLVALSVSLFTALAMLGLHRLKGIDPRAVVVHFSFVAMLFALGAFLLDADRRAIDEWRGIWAFAELMGVGVTATIGQLFLTMAFTHGEPAKVSVVGLTQIVFAFLFDTTLLGHRVSLPELIGVPLVIGPTAWLMWQRRKVRAVGAERVETL